MVQKVWSIRDKRNPSVVCWAPTRETALQRVGTANLEYCEEPEEVELDVVFAVVNGGDSDEGGGAVIEIFHSFQGAKACLDAINVDTFWRSDYIEIYEVKP